MQWKPAFVIVLQDEVGPHALTRKGNTPDTSSILSTNEGKKSAKICFHTIIVPISDPVKSLTLSNGDGHFGRMVFQTYSARYHWHNVKL